MGIELPADLARLATALDVRWPQGDEDKMLEAAKAWRTAGEGVTRLSTETDAVAQHALQSAGGKAADTARRHWNTFVAPDSGTMPLTAKGCLEAAQRLEHAAEQIASTKHQIVAELVRIAKLDDVAKALAGEGNLESLVSQNSTAAGALANLAHLTETLTGAVSLANGTEVDDLAPVTGPGAVDPRTGYRVDAATGLLLDPATGRLIDPQTGNLMAHPGSYGRDETGALIDLRTGKPVDPGSQPLYDPVTGERLDPRTGAPLGGGHGAPAPAPVPELPQAAPGQQPGYDPNPPTGPIELPRQHQPQPPPVYYDPSPTPVHRAPGPQNSTGVAWAGSPDPAPLPAPAPAPAPAQPRRATRRSGPARAGRRSTRGPVSAPACLQEDPVSAAPASVARAWRPVARGWEARWAAPVSAAVWCRCPVAPAPAARAVARRAAPVRAEPVGLAAVVRPVGLALVAVRPVVQARLVVRVLVVRRAPVALVVPVVRPRSPRCRWRAGRAWRTRASARRVTAPPT